MKKRNLKLVKPVKKGSKIALYGEGNGNCVKGCK